MQKGISFVLTLALLNFTHGLHAQGTSFTYQGRLNDGANPASGSYDLRFAIYDSPNTGLQQGATITNSAIAVSNGLFTVTLDFGNQFPGANRWLEIALRTNGASSFFTLSPRQALTPAPYAITAGNLISGGLASGTYGNAVTFNHASNSFSGSFAGNGGNVTNVDAATLGGLSPANFWKTTGNAGTTPGTNFLGTTDNQPLELKVGGLRVLRLELNGARSPNVIAGSPENFVSAGVMGAVIGGGGSSNLLGFGEVYLNSVLSSCSTIGGGDNNSILASAQFATIGGGENNGIASGASDATIGGGAFNGILASEATIGGGGNNHVGGDDSTIGGGGDNQIDYPFYATIGGGQFNHIQNTAHFATIGGGSANTILTNGQYATIPGGSQNTATNYGFAAGNRAKAVNTGAFVWADSQAADFVSTAGNQFLIRASGGVGIGKNNPTTALDVNGTVTATGYSGNGAGLTGLNAGSLASGTIPGGVLSGTYSSALTLNNVNNSFSGTFVGNGANVTNVNAAALNGLNASNFWQFAGNNVAPGKFLGSTNNQALEIRVNGQRALLLTTNSSDSPNIIGGSLANVIDAGVKGAVIAGGGTTNFSGSSSSNRVSADFSSIGGGSGNWIQPGADHSVIGNGWNNLIANSALESVIAGGQGNVISNSYSLVAGGKGNAALGQYSTAMGYQTTAGADFSTAMGLVTTASGTASTAMGDNTTAAGNSSTAMGNGTIASTNYSTAMGLSTTASGIASTAMGYSTTASGDYSTAMGQSCTASGINSIAMGDKNTASGGDSIAMGQFSTATNSFTLAAGRHANAFHQGAFVWADSQNVNFVSTANDQFLIRAQGGVGINKNNPAGALDVAVATGQSLVFRQDSGLVPGINVATTGGNAGVMRLRNAMEVWPSDDATRAGRLDVRNTGGNATISLDGSSGVVTCVSLTQTSDRNAKENFAPVEPREVLEKVAALPLSSWNYKADVSARHLGPMAQDFYSSFNLGTDEKHIAPIDEGGVALAAIQGLNQKVDELKKEMNCRDAENLNLKKELSEIKQLLAKLTGNQN